MPLVIWIDMLTRRDARALYHWWSRKGVFVIRRSLTNPRFWALWRER